MAFIKDDPAKAASLVARIQKLTEANKSKNLRSFVVFMAGPEAGPAVEKMAAEKKITIPATILPQGPSQPTLAPFKINPEAKNTITVYNRRKVHATLVNVDDKSFADLEKATAEMLGQ
jgi:hypothetical protein